MTIRLLILYLFVWCTSASYHTTDYILGRARFLCALNSRMTCTEYDGILVLDWDAERSPDQLWVFNEHARERITGELALAIINDLARDGPDRRITIIPILNAWGRKAVENGRGCQRKNERGVDTNRNYAHHPYYKYGEEYEGPYPLSEKETKLVSTLLLRGTKRYLNIHSGEYSLYMPFDSKNEAPPNAEKMRAMLSKLSPLCPQCVVGSAAVMSSYKAYGTSVDYAINHGIPEAYTFEIYGRDASTCVDMFNPPAFEMQKIINQWKTILFRTVG